MILELTSVQRRELRARAQFSAPEADLLAAVKEVLSRHS